MPPDDISSLQAGFNSWRRAPVFAVGQRVASVQPDSSAQAPPGKGFSPNARVFIGIDVLATGRVSVSLWVDGRWNAIYAPCDVESALQRQLPEALREAVEFAQASPAPTE